MPLPSARDAIIAAELGAGYRRCPYPLASFQPLADQVVVSEHLVAFNAHLLLLRKPHTVLGTVLALGPEAAADGLQVGDTIVYEQWQGGRWCFPDPAADGGEQRVLIMRVEHCQLIVRTEPTGAGVA